MKLKQALPFIIACSAAKLKPSTPSINKENMSSWQIEIPSDNYQYSFSVNLIVTCQIDWGDGIIEDLDTDAINNVRSVTHTYNNAGIYIISLERYHNILNFSNTQSQDTIIRMLYMSENITTYENMFCGCTSLIEIADTCIIQSTYSAGVDENNNQTFRNINFNCMFDGCTSLRAIYGNYTISFNCSQNYSYDQDDRGRYQRIFCDCTSLKIIQPILDFSYCVYLPYIFNNCSQLDTLNINTLPDCLIDASHMFYECNNLSLDISNLFSSNGIGNHSQANSNQIHIDQMFQNCSYLYGYIPADVLWESEKDNIESNDMFKGCTNLSNYNDIPYTYGGIAAIITNTYYSLDIANGNNLMLEYSYNSQHSIEFSSTNASEYGFDVSSDGTITMTSPSDGEFSFSIYITTTDTNTGQTSTIQKYITINVINASYAGGGSGNESGGTTDSSLVTRFAIMPQGSDSGNSGYYEFSMGTNPNEAITIDWGDGTTDTIYGDDYGWCMASHQYSDSYSEYTITITGNQISLDLRYGGNYASYIRRVEAIASSITDCSYMFDSCYNLYDISSDFVLPANATNCAYMFNGCTQLYISDIATLFSSWDDISIERNIEYMFYMYGNGSDGNGNIFGTLPELWNYMNTTFSSTSYAFYGCTNLNNYTDIPESWKNY